MRNQLLIVEKERFFLNDRCKYLIQGVVPEKYTIEAFLDEQKLSVSMEKCVAKSAVERFKDGELLGGQRVEAHRTSGGAFRVQNVKGVRCF